MLVQSFVERLRPLVGIKGWDYIVLWKLSDDHRCLEWMDCCCAGTQDVQNFGEELIFPSNDVVSCRDVLFPHPRIKSCDLLDQLPSTVPLDSGIYAQALSSQVSWLNFSHNPESRISEETIGTRVLIPVSLGLVELFVTKQVSEDQQVIDFIRTQCNIFLEHQAMSNTATMDLSFSASHEIPLHCFSSETNIFSSEPLKENLDLPHTISIERVHLSSNSPLNSLHLSNNQEAGNTNNTNVLFEETYEANAFMPSVENGFQESMIDHSSKRSRWADQMGSVDDQVNENSSLVQETNRSDDSDPNDDEDDVKYRRRNAKEGQSKNLHAERKRRKKLNDRLYSLRALVPNISKASEPMILNL